MRDKSQRVTDKSRVTGRDGLKRSTPLKQGSALKRTPFRRSVPSAQERPERPPVVHTPPPAWRIGAVVSPHPRPAVGKENALQHEAYMAAVRRLPCARCGVVGFTQFCHADEGKGTGIKTDCRRGWPGCGPHNDTMGCHYLLGSTGELGREERRRLEETYARQTRATVRQLGRWPKSLPAWPGDEPANDPQFTNDQETA